MANGTPYSPMDLMYKHVVPHYKSTIPQVHATSQRPATSEKAAHWPINIVNSQLSQRRHIVAYLNMVNI